MISVFFPFEADPGWRDLIPYLGIGSAVGSVFALLCFAVTAFSLPMMHERRVDAITAVVTSVNAVLRNKRAMLLWVTMIVASVLIGLATGFIGFIVTMPLIGHASWHAYRDTIDADAWPLHDDFPEATGAQT